MIRLQTIRAGFPCFNAALAGYVEAPATTTGSATDCVRRTPSPTAWPSWAQMQVLGTIAVRAYGAEPDIATWANCCALNPAAIDPSQRDDPGVKATAARLADHAERGLAGMAELAHEQLSASTWAEGSEHGDRDVLAGERLAGVDEGVGADEKCWVMACTSRRRRCKGLSS